MSDPPEGDPSRGVEPPEEWDDEEVPDDPFTEVEVGEVDEDAVRAGLQDGDAPTAAGTSEEVVVPKRKYCERCEHFADPPNATCTNDGTEILELVDMDHFRVVNCPVVAERRKIGATDIRDPDE